ncbi:MAG: single-stranded DNA-binding protein [Flavobacteriales bacterium]|jgi:single-strand DNA-binding protein|nr:single-stranded DNA-binding protein [Flavobacteriales bacterium]
MTNLRNNVQLIGSLGTQPKVKELPNGIKVARLTLATYEYYKNKEGKIIQETQWHSLVAWNHQATIVERYLEKGKEVCVYGKLHNKSYQDKGGVVRYITEVVVTDILLLYRHKQ